MQCLRNWIFYFFLFLLSYLPNSFSYTKDTTKVANLKLSSTSISTKTDSSHVDLFDKFKWDIIVFNKEGKVISKEHTYWGKLELHKGDRVKLSKHFTVDSAMLNKIFLIKLGTQNPDIFKINGRKILNENHQDDFSFFSSEKFIEVQFTESNIFIELEYTLKIRKIAFSLNFGSSYNSGFPNLELGTMSWAAHEREVSTNELKKEVFKNACFIVFSVLFILLFIFFQAHNEYLFFALYCFFNISACDAVYGYITSDYFVFLFIRAVFRLEFLAIFLALVLFEKKRSRKFLLMNVIAILLYFIGTYLFDSYSSVSGIVFLLVFIVLAFISGFSCLYFLIQGLYQRKWEAKFISYFAIGFAVLAIISKLYYQAESSSETREYIFSNNFVRSMTELLRSMAIPIAMLLILARRNATNYNQLASQVTEISQLSAANIQKEKEKQQLLQDQNNMLEEQVKARTSEVVIQKNLVEEKNRSILDSIEYALRIQTAILPPHKLVKQYLEDSFIFYKPKDIVAGDFYWMETVDEWVLFAACDCTGHGVPGAMVSVVCNNALKRAVNEYGIKQPAAILDKTEEIVVEGFAMSEEEIRDGMDISLCALNLKTLELEWAGANNPLWLIRNGELIETKADKQAIGIADNVIPYTNHRFQLVKNDLIYVFSDGFADQFGGDNGERKLTRKRFKEILLAIHKMDLNEQHVQLEKFIDSYRNLQEQIDDILVIGVKV